MEGEMLTPGEIKWPLWRTCTKAGLRFIGWHVLRHTFASHRSRKIMMTMRYSHLSDVAREAVSLLAGLSERGQTVAGSRDVNETERLLHEQELGVLGDPTSSMVIRWPRAERGQSDRAWVDAFAALSVRSGVGGTR
jgi:hypothetical protein